VPAPGQPAAGGSRCRTPYVHHTSAHVSEKHVTDPATDDALVEVPVHAGVLRATADLLDLINDFFTGADPVTRTRLGRYLVDRSGHQDTTDSTTEAVVMLVELGEAAELLHTLAGNYRPDTD
jgi:hypothetical protein